MQTRHTYVRELSPRIRVHTEAYYSSDSEVLTDQDTFELELRSKGLNQIGCREILATVVIRQPTCFNTDELYKLRDLGERVLSWLDFHAIESPRTV